MEIITDFADLFQNPNHESITESIKLYNVIISKVELIQFLPELLFSGKISHQILIFIMSHIITYQSDVLFLSESSYMINLVLNLKKFLLECFKSERITFDTKKLLSNFILSRMKDNDKWEEIFQLIFRMSDENKTLYLSGMLLDDSTNFINGEMCELHQDIFFKLIKRLFYNIDSYECKQLAIKLYSRLLSNSSEERIIQYSYMINDMIQYFMQLCSTQSGSLLYVSRYIKKSLKIVIIENSLDLINLLLNFCNQNFDDENVYLCLFSFLRVFIERYGQDISHLFYSILDSSKVVYMSKLLHDEQSLSLILQSINSMLSCFQDREFIEYFFCFQPYNDTSSSDDFVPSWMYTLYSLCEFISVSDQNTILYFEHILNILNTSVLQAIQNSCLKLFPTILQAFMDVSAIIKSCESNAKIFATLIPILDITQGDKELDITVLELLSSFFVNCTVLYESSVSSYLEKCFIRFFIDDNDYIVRCLECFSIGFEYIRSFSRGFGQPEVLIDDFVRKYTPSSNLSVNAILTRCENLSSTTDIQTFTCSKIEFYGIVFPLLSSSMQASLFQQFTDAHLNPEDPNVFTATINSLINIVKQGFIDEWKTYLMNIFIKIVASFDILKESINGIPDVFSGIFELMYNLLRVGYQQPLKSFQPFDMYVNYLRDDLLHSCLKFLLINEIKLQSDLDGIIVILKQIMEKSYSLKPHLSIISVLRELSTSIGLPDSLHVFGAECCIDFFEYEIDDEKTCIQVLDLFSVLNPISIGDNLRFLHSQFSRYAHVSPKITSLILKTLTNQNYIKLITEEQKSHVIKSCSEYDGTYEPYCFVALSNICNIVEESQIEEVISVCNKKLEQIQNICKDRVHSVIYLCLILLSSRKLEHYKSDWFIYFLSIFPFPGHHDSIVKIFSHLLSETLIQYDENRFTKNIVLCFIKTLNLNVTLFSALSLPESLILSMVPVVESFLYFIEDLDLDLTIFNERMAYLGRKHVQ